MLFGGNEPWRMLLFRRLFQTAILCSGGKRHGHGGEFHPFCSRFLFAMLELFEPLSYAYSTSRTLWRPKSRETHVCLSLCRSLSAIPFSRCACKQYPRQSFRKRRRRRRRYDKKSCRILEMRFSAGLLFQRLAFLFFILLKCLSLSPPDPPSPCPPSPPLCRNHILQSEEALKMASYLSLLFPFFASQLASSGLFPHFSRLLDPSRGVFREKTHFSHSSSSFGANPVLHFRRGGKEIFVLATRINFFLFSPRSRRKKAARISHSLAWKRYYFFSPVRVE